MEICVATDPDAWNKIVDGSPYSVLHHRYEFCASEKDALPLIIEKGRHCFLFPVNIMNLFKSFRLATSITRFQAALLPGADESIDLIPEALDAVTAFLLKINVDYLSTYVPTFFSRRYEALMSSWFRKHKASIQIIYAHIIPTKNMTFEEIWRHRFRKRVRQDIRNAEREGVSVVKIDSEDAIKKWMDHIHECNVSALVRQGRWGAYPDSYKEVLLSELLSTKKVLGEHFNIYGAIYKDHLIAYQIVLEYNKLITGTKTASRAKYFDKHPNDLLVAHLVKEACERGFYWLEKGFDRVRSDEKIPSLTPGVRMWKRKFGFEEVPIPIYRLGLTRSGRMLQHLYAVREHIFIKSALLPKPFRDLFLKSYAPRRRKLTLFTYA